MAGKYVRPKAKGRKASGIDVMLQATQGKKVSDFWDKYKVKKKKKK